MNTPLISQFIVVKTTLPQYKDEWAVVDSYDEALELYNEALEDESTYVVSITVNIKSSDYATEEGHIDFTDEGDSYRLTIQKTHAGPQEDDQ